MLERLVFQPSTFGLAPKHRIALQSELIIEPTSFLAATLATKRHVKHLKACAHPEVVARVYKLVDAPVKGTLSQLVPPNQPLCQGVQPQLFSLTEKHQRREAAVCVPSVSLTERSARHPAFVGLAGSNIVCDPFRKLSFAFFWE